jgi:hypothetical protein
VIASLDFLFVVYLMARGDCVSGFSICSVSYGQRGLCVSQTDNPETQSSRTIRYRTNRQSRDTIISDQWSEMIVSLDCLFVLYLMARGDCVSGLSVCSASYGQR